MKTEKNQNKNIKTPEINLEEGMFYEKVFSPTSLKMTSEFVKNLKGEEKEIRTLELFDDNGEQMTVVGDKLIRKVCYYLRKNTEFKGLQTCKPMMDLETQKLAKVLQGSLNVGKVNENPITLRFLRDHQDEIISITSSRHSQISWATLRSLIEDPINDLLGKPERLDFGTGNYSYKLPIKNKNVSAWLGIDVGNNIAEGRSGIRIFTRFRTEAPSDKLGGGIAPCLNWANLWQEPLRFFNIPVKRIHNEIEGGELTVNPLNMFEIHVKNTAVGIEDVKKQIAERLPEIVRAVKEYLPVFINKSKNVELTYDEMKNILTAYQEKVHLPQYAVDQIMAVAKWQKDETVWGFSNAVSWVRTHGEFRTGKYELNDRTLVRSLESIAGEIYSLTPTIQRLKELVGKIEIETLTDPKKETVQKMTEMAVIVTA